MQIAGIPLKWYVPFATNDPNKVEIPVTTSDTTRASQSLGFPPATMQPPESGGVPPQGEDFNGAMNQVARIAFWLMAGGPFPFDLTFASNANVNGYPQGSRIATADYLGQWICTADNNQTNPDANTAVGWLPGPAYGALALTGLTNSNVTLTPAQAIKPVITLAGVLTGSITIILPAWIRDWRVVNNTSGAFTVTFSYTTGAGAVIPQNGQVTPIRGDGTNVYLDAANIGAATAGPNAVTATQIQTQAVTGFTAGGTAPAFAITAAPAITAYVANQRFRVRFTVNGTTGSNTLNINGQGAVALMQYDATGTLVPATIVSGMLTDIEYNGTSMVVLDAIPASNGVVSSVRGLFSNLLAVNTVASFTIAEVIAKTALGGGSYLGANLSLSFNAGTTGANGMDTGTLPASGYIALYAIYSLSTNTWAILGTNATSSVAPEIYGGAHMPSGYIASALISIIPTTVASQLATYVQIDRNVKRSSVQTVVTSTATSQPAYTAMGLSGSIPMNARTIAGTFQLGNSAGTTQTTVFVSASSVGIATTAFAAYIQTSGAVAIAPFADVAVSPTVAQTIYYALWAGAASTTTLTVLIGGYTF